MRIFLNDKEIQTSDSNDLMTVLTTHQLSERNGIAVAVNEEIIPKNSWESCVLNENDKIMIITATAGG